MKKETESINAFCTSVKRNLEPESEVEAKQTLLHKVEAFESVESKVEHSGDFETALIEFTAEIEGAAVFSKVEDAIQKEVQKEVDISVLQHTVLPFTSVNCNEIQDNMEEDSTMTFNSVVSSKEEGLLNANPPLTFKNKLEAKEDSWKVINYLYNTMFDKFSKMDKLTTKESLSFVRQLLKTLVHRFFVSANNLVDTAKCKRLVRHFVSGDLIRSEDFLLFRKDNSLMVFAYLGSAAKIEIPSLVGSLPVAYLHPNFLYNDGSSSIKFQYGKLHNKFSQISVRGVSFQSLQNLHINIEQILLPNTLVSLLSGTFSGCRRLERICIPKNVQYLSPDVLSNSGITSVYFNGICPEGYRYVNYLHNVFVVKEYLMSYQEEKV